MGKKKHNSTKKSESMLNAVIGGPIEIMQFGDSDYTGSKGVVGLKLSIDGNSGMFSPGTMDCSESVKAMGRVSRAGKNWKRCTRDGKVKLPMEVPHYNNSGKRKLMEIEGEPLDVTNHKKLADKSRKKVLFSLIWWRLVHSPASHNECFKLKLPRAWEPWDGS